MNKHFHFLVWVDHEVAKIVNFNDQEAMCSVVRSARGHPHLHHKANARGSGHVGIDKDFMERIARELESAGAVVIAGPASAKTELVQHIYQHHAKLASCLSGVETLDHPTDGELIAFGRRFFRADDRMRAQKHQIHA